MERKRKKRKMMAAIVVFVGLLAACTPTAAPAPPASEDEVHAALATAFPEPDLQAKAHSIMHCESGHNVNAVNGQYRGLFQHGYNYNGTISVTNDGNIFNALTSALVARATYNARGNWSAWSCA